MSEFDCSETSCDSCASNCNTDGQATVTLTLDDDTTQECAVLTIFPVEDNQYIALLPLDENGENEDGEVFIYRYFEKDGQPNLENIESDEEYDKVADAFDELLDAEEYDELADDDEADE